MLLDNSAGRFGEPPQLRLQLEAHGPRLEDRPDVAARIKKLGELTLDEKSRSKPVVKVSLNMGDTYHWARVSDATVGRLRVLSQLQELDLTGTRA